MVFTENSDILLHIILLIPLALFFLSSGSRRSDRPFPGRGPPLRGRPGDQRRGLRREQREARPRRGQAHRARSAAGRQVRDFNTRGQIEESECVMTQSDPSIEPATG